MRENPLLYEGEILTYYRNEGCALKPKQDLSSKPYYRCFICPRFRTLCGGRPTRGMDLPTWCEYIGDTMDYFGLSIPYVAKTAGVSEATVERIKYRKVSQDFMRGTIILVEQVVLGLVGEFTCYLDHDNTVADQIATLQAEISALREDVAYWKKENDRKAKIIDKYLE